MNTERLEGKVIVITGAASGMGMAFAIDFANRGAKIAILDINENQGKKLEKEIQKQGNKAIYYKIDVTKKKEIEDVASKIEKSLGNITTWINSAGVSRMAPFLDSGEDLWDKTIDVNLKATFLCCQVAIKYMLQNQKGEIVNLSSLSGKKPSGWQTIYCASKFGVQGLSQSIAKEFADHNIRVNTICPGIVPTEMWETLKYDYAKKRGMAPEDVLPYFKSNIPMHRLVEIQDVINAAIFLITDNSSYLTGQSINLVGGELTE
ncbi:MAG: SDR family NAD(P)-dependent oxidoreductase [Breznakia sp.]